MRPPHLSSLLYEVAAAVWTEGVPCLSFDTRQGGNNTTGSLGLLREEVHSQFTTGINVYSISEVVYLYCMSSK